MGTFAAEDEEEAKKKLFSHGYSIIQLKVIPETDSPHEADFFLHPTYPEEEREKKRGLAAMRAASEAPHEPVAADQQKSIAILILLCAVLAAIGIAVFFLMRPQKDTAALSPQQVVRSYLTLGFRGSWTVQYPLLGGERSERYITVGNYAQQIARNWLDLPAQTAVSSAEGAVKPEVPHIEITPLKSYGSHAEVGANVLVSNDKRRFVFQLHFDGAEWRIHYIRDLGKTESHVRFLALNPQGPRRDAVLNEMQLDFGLTAEEIGDLVKLYHLKNVESELQASIETNKEDDEVPAPREEGVRYAEPFVEKEKAEVTVESQEVETHLSSLMNMVESMEKESKERL